MKNWVKLDHPTYQKAMHEAASDMLREIKAEMIGAAVPMRKAKITVEIEADFSTSPITIHHMAAKREG